MFYVIEVSGDLLGQSWWTYFLSLTPMLEELLFSMRDSPGVVFFFVLVCGDSALGGYGAE